MRRSDAAPPRRGHRLLAAAARSACVWLGARRGTGRRRRLRGPYRDCSSDPLGAGCRRSTAATCPSSTIIGMDLHGIDFAWSDLIARRTRGCDPDLPRTNLAGARIAPGDPGRRAAVRRDPDRRRPARLATSPAPRSRTRSLDRANLSWATLDGADAALRAVHGRQPVERHLARTGPGTGATFDGADLHRIDFRGTDLRSTTLRRRGPALRAARRRRLHERRPDRRELAAVRPGSRARPSRTRPVRTARTATRTAGPASATDRGATAAQPRSSRRPRARPAPSATRVGAVPPMTSHDASAPSTDAAAAQAVADGLVRGEGLRRPGRRSRRAPGRSSSRARSSSRTPASSACATSEPTTWWATRNGMPRRTSASATAVAVV